MALARVDYFDLRYDSHHKSPVLFLKDADRDRFLPVWIGELEASSIELAVIHKAAPRPLTHDLFAGVLRDLGVRITKVVIDRLESRTYFANLHLEQRGQELVVDCRPSDAIALALREDVVIFVDDELMYNIKFVEVTDQDAEDEGAEVLHEGEGEVEEEGFQDFLRQIRPQDFREN
jgi:uncharacterized protein